MARGGYRSGAGKPKGYKAPHTLEASAAKQRIIARVSAQIDELVDMLLNKALEHKDVYAAKELLDRAYGKAPQAITGAEGGALQITFDNALKDEEKLCKSCSAKGKKLTEEHRRAIAESMIGNKQRETASSPEGDR